MWSETVIRHGQIVCIMLGWLVPKSLYISRATSNFHGTEFEIWAGFGPVGSTENYCRK